MAEPKIPAEGGGGYHGVPGLWSGSPAGLTNGSTRLRWALGQPCTRISMTPLVSCPDGTLHTTTGTKRSGYQSGEAGPLKSMHFQPGSNLWCHPILDPSIFAFYLTLQRSGLWGPVQIWLKIACWAALEMFYTEGWNSHFKNKYEERRNIPV